MTSQDLHAIYLAAYAESSHFESPGPRGASRLLARRFRLLLPAERAVVELARHDATDGRPMRSRTGFESALRLGRQVLTGLPRPVGGDARAPARCAR